MGLFKAFSKVSEADWWAKVEKDLKGRAMEELNWQLEEDLTMKPFYTTETTQEINLPISTTNDWEISEDVIVEDAKTANQKVLHALMNGVNAPTFILKSDISVNDFKILLNDIELSFISTHFEVPTAESFKAFLSYLRQQHQLWSNISGSFSIKNTPADQLHELIQIGMEALPYVKLLHLNGSKYYQGKAQTTTELANIIHEASQIFDQLKTQNISAGTIQHQIHVSLSVGTSFFASIAKIKAFKLLWLNLVNAYQVENPTVPSIHIRTAVEDEMNDQNTNMIRTTTQAMSAVIGGIQRLTVTPSDAFGGTSTDFTRRIARNVQHLLKLESHLNHVIDPAKGSYYVENMTKQMAEIAWQKFVGMDEQKFKSK